MEILLSKQDPRELPKGSRDPLGFEVLWTRYGRRVIGNLTTITGSIDEFLTALFGFYLSESCSEKQMECFIRYEQVVGYLREYSGKGGFVRGVSRVKERLKQLEKGEIKAVTISTSKRDMILSNQSAYGLWGLYSTALDVSGLIEDRVTKDEGKRLAEKMENEDHELTSFIKHFMKEGEQKLELDEIERYAPRFLKLLQDNFKKELLGILLSGPIARQSTFFELVKELDKAKLISVDETWSVVEYMILSDEAPNDLRNALSDIMLLDLVLTLANTLFDYMRLPENNKHLLSDIVMKIREQDPQQLVLELPQDLQHAELKQFVKHWNQGDYESALRQILKLHQKIVYDQRGSAPWVELNDNGQIKQREENPHASLDIMKKHYYSYFLDSYFRMYRTYRKINA